MPIKILRIEGDGDEIQLLQSCSSISLENIPPTQEALKQHIRKASLQSVGSQVQLIGVGRRTEQDGNQYESSYHCVCKKGCTGRCKCSKASLCPLRLLPHFYYHSKTFCTFKIDFVLIKALITSQVKMGSL